MYVPAALPLVFQLNEALVLYDWTTVQAPPGGEIQNWYSGLGQPEAWPATVTAIPVGAGEAEEKPTLTVVHGLVRR